MKDKTKCFFVGCATIMVWIIAALVLIGLFIGVLILFYARWGNIGAVSTILAFAFILIALLGLILKNG